MPHERSCTATKADGKPCGAPASVVDPETGLCPSHDPEKVERVREGARKGGEATARRFHDPGQLTTDDLPPLTDHEAAEIWTDAIGRAVATDNLSGAAANAALRAVQTFLQARDAGEVSDRLDAFADAMAEWQRTGNREPMLELVGGGE